MFRTMIVLMMCDGNEGFRSDVFLERTVHVL